MNELEQYSMTQLKKAYGPKTFNNNYLPYYNVGVGESITLRFLPDRNADNPLKFLKVRQYHVQVDGDKVACVENCSLCRQAYNLKHTDHDQYKRLKAKSQYLANVLVLSGAYNGQVRLVAFGWTIYNTISQSIINDDVVPYEQTAPNFILRKTDNGSYPVYTTSSFDELATTISDDEWEVAIANLIDLETLV